MERLRLSWLWSRLWGPKGKHKTVNIFFGFFLLSNYCLGTGFLAIPYAFFYAGYLAAVPTLLLVAFVSWVNGNYLLEVMARAQVSIIYVNVNGVKKVDLIHFDSYGLS